MSGTAEDAMFTLTVIQAALLGLGLVAAVAVLVVGVCFAAPRTTRLADVSVECPLLGRRVAARLVWDEWAVRFVDVARCSALDGYSEVICAKRCLGRGSVTRPLAPTTVAHA
jgi:hypothetical protein